MPIMTGRGSSRELLPRVLHELAQPVSALQCSLEVALRNPRATEVYLETMKGALEIASCMRERLAYFRDLAEAVEPCDCDRPVEAAAAIEAAMGQMREFAESIGTKLHSACAAMTVFGNQPKLVFICLRMLEGLLATGQNATLQVRAEHKIFCSVRMQAQTREAREFKRESRELLEGALATMGGKLRLQSLPGGLLAEVRLSAYRQAATGTEVSLRDF